MAAVRLSLLVVAIRRGSTGAVTPRGPSSPLPSTCDNGARARAGARDVHLLRTGVASARVTVVYTLNGDLGYMGVNCWYNLGKLRIQKGDLGSRSRGFINKKINNEHL